MKKFINLKFFKVIELIPSNKTHNFYSKYGLHPLNSTNINCKEATKKVDGPAIAAM